MEPSEADAVVLEPMTRVGHMLIRAYNHDTFDPFLIDGHPNLAPNENRIVRSCFYYSIIMSPKATLLFDNDGAGGMCRMTVDEIAAAWRTPKLLEALGTTFEALRDGTATVLAEHAPPPDVNVFEELAKEASGMPAP